MATHSSILAWRIPGTGEPGGLPSMASHRVGHDWSDLASAAASAGEWSKSKGFFPGGSDCKESSCNAGDLGSIPVLGRSPGEGNGNPLRYSCLENPHEQRSLTGYSPWGRKELDRTEWLSIHRMVKIQNAENTKYWRGCGSTGKLVHCWWECKMVQPLRMTVWQFSLQNQIYVYHVIQQPCSFIFIQRVENLCPY